MNYQELWQAIQTKKSYLCVGLDSDISKIPQKFLKEKTPILAFNKYIIEETSDFAVAYKINTAFYEALGATGWEIMQKTLEYIPNNILQIADAKRGDIGNTVKMYAKAFFEHLNVDAITVAPYMGQDSVSPFMTYKDKWVILLALTSNPSSQDFQLLEYENQKLYEKVIQTSTKWGNKENLMYVVGATQAQALAHIRQMIPHHFLLVPGVGHQGGSLEEVSKFGLNPQGGLLINSSRGIIYADSPKKVALNLQKEMETFLEKFF